MTAADFRAWLHRMDLTQVRAGQLLGIDQGDISRMAAGDRPVSRVIDLACAKLWDDRASAQEWRSARAEAARMQFREAA